MSSIMSFIKSFIRQVFSYRPDFEAIRIYLTRLFGVRLLGRFVVLNILGVASFAGGFLILSESRQTLATAYEESLHVQARIIAGALSQAMNDREYDSLVFSDENITDGWQVREAIRIVQRIGYVTPARVRLYSRSGQLTLDSAYVDNNNDVVARSLAPIDVDISLWQKFVVGLRGSRPLLNEIIAADGLNIDEVSRALAGEATRGERQAPDGGDILTVAVPVQGYRDIVGALMVSTPPGLIDNLVRETRQTVLEITIVAIIVSFATSLIMAATVIIPIRSLARSMRFFGQHFGKTAETQASLDSIPDYSERNDEIAYLSTTLRDMTERLIKRITMIDSFAADVAHELKNPLTSLHSGVQTLAQTKDEDTRARLNQIIDNDVRRLNHLITEISRASRLDAELGISTGEIFDLAHMAEEMGAALMQNYAEKQKVELVVKTLTPHIADTKSMVRGHPQRIAQIIDNLLANAVSFTPEGGKIYMTIQATTTNNVNNVVLMITDEGPGLREGMEKRIFERFYRDRSHTQNIKGSEGALKEAAKKTDEDPKNVVAMHSGLGLSISLQIAQAYGGTLVAANRPDNVQGAFFTLTLPLAGALTTGNAYH